MEIENKNIIKQPAAYLWVGIAGIIFVLFFSILIVLEVGGVIKISTSSKEELPFYLLLFLPVLIFFIYIVLISALWKIEIYEDEFMYRNLFAKKKIYKFNEVTIVPKSASVRVHYKGKKVINISYLQSNSDALQKAIANFKKKKQLNQ